MSTSSVSVSFDSVKENQEGESSSFRKTPHPSKKKPREGDSITNKCAATPASTHDEQRETVFGVNKDYQQHQHNAPNKKKVLEEVTNTDSRTNEHLKKGEEQKNGQEAEAATEESDDAMQDVDVYSSDDEEWQAVCKKIESEPPTSLSRANLADFTEAMKMSRDARETLETKFASTIQVLTETFDGAVNQVKADTEQWSHALEARRVEILKLAQTNHQRRKDLVNQLTENYRVVEKTHAQLAAAVMNEFVYEEEEENSGQKSQQDRQDASEKKPLRDTEGEIDQEPNWEELLQFDPMRDTTKLFMEASELMKNADGGISTALDNAANTFKDCLEHIENVTGDAYLAIATTLDNQQGEIQQQMASNLERRIDFEIAVREQAEQSKNFFQQLMGTIRNATCTSASPATDSSRPKRRSPPCNP